VINFADAVDNSERAAEAYRAMQRRFYRSTTRLYREVYPYDRAQDRPLSYLWSFEEATAATLAMYGMPNGGSRYKGAILGRFDARERYWDGRATRRAYRSYPPDGDRFYDDNCWVGTDLVQHYLLTHEPSGATALDRARSVFRYIQTGWTTNLPNPGGVRWTDSPSNGDRAADSTAGWSKLGAQLYEATERRTRSYLDWAVNAYLVGSTESEGWSSLSSSQLTRLELRSCSRKSMHSPPR